MKFSKFRKHFVYLCFLLSIVNFIFQCGGTGSSTSQTITDPAPEPEPILTDKLIGTPFEGMTTADNIPICQFLQGDYLTTTVDQVPIPVFLAFFTASEEEIIKQGIELTNTGVGYEAFSVTDTWSNDCRVIVKANTIQDINGDAVNAIGYVSTWQYDFGTSFTTNLVSDWYVEIRSDKISSIGEYIIAHELGHAFGIEAHALVDYTNDALVDLEENSIMIPSMPVSTPTFTDYNYMMNIQGQILLDHLGEVGEDVTSVCD